MLCISFLPLIFPYSAQILLKNALFYRQNACLKNRLFCSKFCRQNLSKPSLKTLIKEACFTASDLSALLLPVSSSPRLTYNDSVGNFPVSLQYKLALCLWRQWVYWGQLLIKVERKPIFICQGCLPHVIHFYRKGKLMTCIEMKQFVVR